MKRTRLGSYKFNKFVMGSDPAFDLAFVLVLVVWLLAAVPASAAEPEVMESWAELTTGRLSFLRGF